jgi:hypothetical protein
MNDSELIAVFFPAILGFLALGIPLVKLLGRTGHSRWLVLLMLLPLLNLVFLWVFAFKKWPIDNK